MRVRPIKGGSVLGWLWVIILVIGVPAPGPAQTSGIAADIVVVVTDETGAFLPGATVTVISNTTGVSRTLVTDEKGWVLAASVQPGSYKVSSELAGFASVTLSQVTVALNQRANLAIQMKVASVAENITVSGESASIVETAKTEVSTLINERAIQELPINVRNPLQFILTAPGTTNQRTTTGSGYSFGGSRARNNSSVLDGVDNNDDSIRGFLAQPSLDAVREFQVMASNFSAEYGRASGGVVNTILKSGTNRFRGSGFYFIRDRSFAANNFFTNANPANPPGFKPFFRQQQPGASIGGPLRHNELFFFTSYEHFRTDSFNNVTISPANTAIINNVLAGRYDLVPNLGPNFPRGIKLGYDKIGGPGEFPATQRRHILVEKVDWQTSPNVALFGRYLYNRNRTLGSGSALNDNTRNNTLGMNNTHSIAASYTHILSPRTLNDFRFQYQTFTTGGQLLDSIGPGLNISGVGNFGRNLNQPQGRTQTRYQFIDNYGVQMGRHELKAGVDINKVRIESSLPGTNAGPLGGLGGVFTFGSLAAFLDGNAVNFLQGFGTSGTTRSWWNYGVFVQDSFKPVSNLTVNAGVRWEMQTMPEVVDVLNPTSHKIHQDMNNFAPRIGVAYNPDGKGKLVIRSGYGIYYDMVFANITGNLAQFNGVSVKTITLTGADAAARFRGQNFGFPAGALPNTPPPAGWGSTVWESPSPIPDSAFPPQTISTADPNLPTALAHHAHLTVERELARNISLSAAYLYNKHLKEPALRNTNLPPPIPGPGGRNLYNINTRRSEFPDPRIFINNEFQGIGKSEYDALVLEFKQRFNDRMQFNASWTFSHAIDYIPDAIFDVPYASDQNNLEADRGNSLQDQRHKVSFSGVFMTPMASSGGVWRILGDINIAPIVSLGSPFFYNITTGNDTNGDGVINDRPIGAGRNTHEGDTVRRVDLRISRGFRLGGTRTMQVIAEAFNIFNTVNFTNFNMTWGAGAYPDSPVATFGRPTLADDPRIVQFGIRYTF
jgi:carboxypeptidase family protein/TonB-dependent receptor-like protein